MFPYIFHQILPSFPLSILYLLFSFLFFTWVTFSYSQIMMTCALFSHIHDEPYHKCKKRKHHVTVLWKYLIIPAFTLSLSLSLSLSNLNLLTPPLLAHSLSLRYLIAHIFFTIFSLTNECSSSGDLHLHHPRYFFAQRQRPNLSYQSIR